MARRLNATQRQRARAKLAARKGIGVDRVTDAMIDQALNVGDLSLSDCGSSGSSDTSDTSGGFTSSVDSSPSGGDCG